jgi:glycosyltransferase involved in cell wall biosynthesis
MRSQIHSILLVKNEEDIIEACLRSACAWSDLIYVYDGASTDRTWEIVQSLKNDQIVPFKQDGSVFKEGLRAEVFNTYKRNAREGDWWCQLNADEFYVDDPRSFLASIDRSHMVVWAIFVQYYLTHDDVSELDFTLPMEELLPAIRYYDSNWAEPRFFRHRPRLSWSENSAWPEHLCVTSDRLLRFRHYPYRSPSQIQQRLDVRRDNRERGFEGWEHAKELTWREKLVPSSGLERDSRDGVLVTDYRKFHGYRGTQLRRYLQHICRVLGIWP